MKTLQVLLGVVMASMLLSSCSNSDDLTIDPVNFTQEQSSSAVDKKKITLEFIDLMNNSDFKKATMGMLKKQQPSVSLSKILKKTSSFVAQQESYKSLVSKTTILEKRASKDVAPEKIEILEVWMHNTQNTTDFSNVLFSFAPEGDEDTWTVIEAYTADKELVYLDPKKSPEFPVIVIETDGFETLKKEVAYMNEYLQEKGIQNNRFSKTNANRGEGSSINSGLETTKLDKISLKNDEEPWVSGAAELYAITSGIRDINNEPEIKIIPMYYLDYSGTDYYPNQILLFWDDYKYQAANIQLFEKDDNINYKSFVSTIVSGVFQVIGVVSAEPWVNVLGEVAGAIIEAMPNDWYTNTDDYIDSFYTIEKNKSYTDYHGAGGNAKVSMSPFFVSSN